MITPEHLTRTVDSLANKLVPVEKMTAGDRFSEQFACRDLLDKSLGHVYNYLKSKFMSLSITMESARSIYDVYERLVQEGNTALMGTDEEKREKWLLVACGIQRSLAKNDAGDSDVYKELLVHFPNELKDLEPKSTTCRFNFDWEDPASV